MRAERWIRAARRRLVDGCMKGAVCPTDQRPCGLRAESALRFGNDRPAACPAGYGSVPLLLRRGRVSIWRRIQRHAGRGSVAPDGWLSLRAADPRTVLLVRALHVRPRFPQLAPPRRCHGPLSRSGRLCGSGGRRRMRRHRDSSTDARPWRAPLAGGPQRATFRYGYCVQSSLRSVGTARYQTCLRRMGESRSWAALAMHRNRLSRVKD
ncbi:hypothetical protein CDEF62S_01997 [Castellaniella defragrans]